MSTERPYHHGDLRHAVLAAAVQAIAESGPAAISLRDLAQRAGVSHAAPAHHFGDKKGMLTAVAAQGYGLLADTLAAVQQRTGDFAEVGAAYVRFAVEHRAHFEVMFRPELYHADDPSVLAASERAAESLYGGVRSLASGALGLGVAGGNTSAQAGADVQVSGVAAWSLVHGFATLWLNHALPPELGDDPVAAARTVAKVLFRTG